MSPTIACLRDGADAAADMPATRRSILRYLVNYERDWEREEVFMPAWHFQGCRPPEEDNKFLVMGRVRMALGQLSAEGLVHQNFHREWALTTRGRQVAQELLR